MSSVPAFTSPGFFTRERLVAGPAFSRWLVPPAALAIHLCIGMAYGFSVFWLPLSLCVMKSGSKLLLRHTGNADAASRLTKMNRGRLFLAASNHLNPGIYGARLRHSLRIRQHAKNRHRHRADRR